MLEHKWVTQNSPSFKHLCVLYQLTNTGNTFEQDDNVWAYQTFYRICKKRVGGQIIGLNIVNFYSHG